MVFYWSSSMPIIVTVFIALMSLIVIRAFARSFRNRDWLMNLVDRHLRPSGRSRPPRPGLVGAAWLCLRRDCRAVNPDHGRFCRLCGSKRF